MNNWLLSDRADPTSRIIADRHYNRQKPGSRQFVPPGRCLILRSADNGALWVTSWPFAQYVKHAWGGAWINSLFRREYGPLASELIREAVAVTKWRWPDVPELGMITFIDPREVIRKRDFGRCYLRAGFTKCGITKGGLLAFQLLPQDMPEPNPPHPSAQMEIW
jgi:hypothetical protein